MKQLPCIKQNVLGYWKTNTESQPIIAIIYLGIYHRA